MLTLAPDYVLNRTPYVAGKPIKKDIKVDFWAKLASNENCLGPSKMALLKAQESLQLAHFYPNAFRHEVVDNIAQFYHSYGVLRKNITLGNGSSELIVNSIRGLVFKNEAIVSVWPTFISYRQAAQVHGIEEISVPLDQNLDYNLDYMLKAIHANKERVKIVFIVNPNNPTGSYIKKDDFEQFVKLLPEGVVLIIDEAYAEYVTNEDYPMSIPLSLKRPFTIVLRTFSKAYGMAGLRLGYAIGCEKVIDVLCKVRDHFNVNSAVQYAAVEALKDQEHIQKTILHNQKMIPLLSAGLQNLGFMVKDSVCNFVLAKKSKDMPDMTFVCNELFNRGVIIRPMDSYDMPEHVRISVGTKEEIDYLFYQLTNGIL